jgi:hypothetical protein
MAARRLLASVIERGLFKCWGSEGTKAGLICVWLPTEEEARATRGTSTGRTGGAPFTYRTICIPSLWLMTYSSDAHLTSKMKATGGLNLGWSRERAVML